MRTAPDEEHDGRGSRDRGKSSSRKSQSRFKKRRNATIGGIHQRRDKKWPLYVPPGHTPVPEADQPAHEAPAHQPRATKAAMTDGNGSASHKALQLWLRWNDAYEKTTACMFDRGQDRRAIEDLMDQLDQLRLQAVRLSRTVVSQVDAG
jgi:hypothetical protein